MKRSLKILLIGNKGQLGWELHRALAGLGQLTAVDLPEVDLTDEKGLRAFVWQVKPNLIVNPAAYTAVDRAESEPEVALIVNGRAPRVLAEEAQKLNAGLIHYSTDYVFDGAAQKVYTETDIPKPLNVYGQTKLSGERAIQQIGGAFLILRTSWVYSTRQGGFLNKVLQWALQEKVMRIVSDQVSGPTWCRMLAEATAHLVVMGLDDIHSWLMERRGLYHLAGSGYTNRLNWAEAIIELDPRREEQIVQKIQPTLTEDFSTPAKRPLFTPLDCSRFEDVFGFQLPDWKVGLRLALAD